MDKFFCYTKKLNTKKLNTKKFDLVLMLNQFDVKLNNEAILKDNKGIESNSISSLSFYFKEVLEYES